MRSWISNYLAAEQHASCLGGKGLNLFRLQQMGAQVPAFGVVSTAAYATWLASGEKLEASLLAEILAEVATWNTPYVAVRSSMSNEDGAKQSYAGMMESYLYVSPDDIGAMIEACFRSLRSARVQTYEQGTQGSPSQQQAAVIVQKMVPARVSGVAFSRAPLGDSALVHIEAGLGLGEGVVSGLVEVDSFLCDRWQRLIKATIQKKTKAIYFAADRSHGARVSEQVVPGAEGDLPALTESELQALTAEVLRLESLLGYPIDIEWAMGPGGAGTVDASLYILQVRPITQSFPALRYFIDTNLSESYPGLSSPLTASFVRHGYTTTAKESLLFLGVSDQRMSLLNQHLDALVSDIGGHMYYNLSSYYSLLSSLPGGQTNIERWHHMIGGAHTAASQLQPVAPLSRFESAKAYLAIIKLMAMHGPIFRRFYSQTTLQRRALQDNLRQANRSAAAAAYLGHALQSTRGFGLTALNDFLIMILIKWIIDLLASAGLNEDLLPQLVKTDAGVESLRPLHDLQAMVAAISDPNGFFTSFEAFLAAEVNAEWEFEAAYTRLYAHLTAAGFATEASAMQAYLTAWGQRSFEELKLESLTLQQAPALLLRLMKFTQRGQARARSVQNATSAALPKIGLRRGLALRILVFLCHKTIATREQTRLVRGHYFGLIRDGLLQCASLLRREQPEAFGQYTVSEFFGLNFDTLVSFGAGSINSSTLQAEIEAYRARPAPPAEFPEQLCIAEGSALVSFPGALIPASAPAKVGSLAGLGAARGIVEGEVLRLENPEEAFAVGSLSNKILVTRTTDPAWVFIMAQCSGLVSEKGSLLSHTAIIGREMGIPTVVGVPAAMTQLQTGERIRINGETGSIERMQHVES